MYLQTEDGIFPFAKMDDEQDEPMSLDEVNDVIQYSPFGELSIVIAGSLARQEPGTHIMRVQIKALNELASRWLVRGLSTNFYSFMHELSTQVPTFVEMSDEHIDFFSLHPESMGVVHEVATALAVRYFIFDIEEEIHSLGPNSLRKMLEELATLLGDSINPYLLESKPLN